MLLINKYPINEEYIKSISDPSFKEGSSKSLGEKILEKKVAYELKFKKQYQANEYSLRKVML
jgi:hypothetical protein